MATSSTDTSTLRCGCTPDRDELAAVVREHLAGHVEPRLLSVQAAARALGISEAACWQLVDQGNGPLRSLKVGRRRLIPRQWLDEYVAELVAEAS